MIIIFDTDVSEYVRQIQIFQSRVYDVAIIC